MSFTRPLGLSLLVATLAAIPLSAAVPGQMNYQGLLLDDQGQPVTGNVDLVFALYDVPSGGTALWSEAHGAVPVLDGVYDVVLGSVTPLTPPILAGGALYLEIEVEGETLVPRQRLVAVPYAMRTAEADNVGGISAAYFTEIIQHYAFDGSDPPNDDPQEGLADVDGDGVPNFLDPDNDGDGLSEAEEISLGTDINLVTPTITGFDPSTAPASFTSTVTVEGTNFEPGIAVVFGSETPTPVNVTSTTFDVEVGPQPEGTVSVQVTRTNGESASGSFEFLDPTPVISALDPPKADSSATTVVTVNGSGFLPGIDVTFGSETPTPQNVTATSLEVTVGPQASDAAEVTLSYPVSGKQDSAEFLFVDASDPKIVFATSTLHSGDLGGLAGADAICNDRAAAAALPGTYLAWMGDGTTDPASRFFKGSPYQRVDGSPLATDFLDLTDGSIQNPVGLSETGGTAGSPTKTWTGVFSDGTTTPDTCNGWTFAGSDLTYTGTFGLTSSTDGEWTDLGVQTCDQEHRLYCVQQ